MHCFCCNTFLRKTFRGVYFVPNNRWGRNPDRWVFPHGLCVLGVGGCWGQCANLEHPRSGGGTRRTSGIQPLSWSSRSDEAVNGFKLNWQVASSSSTKRKPRMNSEASTVYLVLSFIILCRWWRPMSMVLTTRERGTTSFMYKLSASLPWTRGQSATIRKAVLAWQINSRDNITWCKLGTQRVRKGEEYYRLVLGECTIKKKKGGVGSTLVSQDLGHQCRLCCRPRWSLAGVGCSHGHHKGSDEKSAVVSGAGGSYTHVTWREASVRQVRSPRLWEQVPGRRGGCGEQRRWGEEKGQGVLAPWAAGDCAGWAQSWKPARSSLSRERPPVCPTASTQEMNGWWTDNLLTQW